MSSNVDVIAPGTPVKIGGETDGVVLALSVSGKDFVRYEVAWWVGNTRTTAWVESHEVTPSERKAADLRLGFSDRKRIVE